MTDRKRRRLGGAVAVLVGAPLIYRAVTGRRRALGSSRGHEEMEIERSISVQRPRQDVYTRWRDPATQPLVWSHFADVTGATDRGAHWRVNAPLRRTLEWDTQIVEEREGELIRWEATDGADLPHHGSVEFRDAPGEWGTEVALRVRFDAPGSAIGRRAPRFFDEPPKLVLAKALRRFKSLVESGEIPSTEPNPSGRDG
jgi:uncharacterized membrane protein